jgi:biotin carboxyl carrier protein
MTCDVEIRGRRRTIEVRQTGPDWELSVDGRILGVNVTAIGERWSFLIGRRSYEVALDRRSNGERIVHVSGVAVPVSIIDPRARRRASGATAGGTATRSIASPMPGRIVKVLVKAGDVVAAHQGLVVVEAMKMENELKAPRAGRVADVKVVDGMSVEAHAVLVTMDFAS